MNERNSSLECEIEIIELRSHESADRIAAAFNF